MNRVLSIAFLQIDLEIEKISIITVKVHERITVANTYAFNFADKDGVIAAVVGVSKYALKRHESVLEDGNTADPCPKTDALEFVDLRKREAFGKVIMPGRQKVNDKYARVPQRVVTAGCLLDADKDERRIERDRAECRHRYPMRHARLVHRRHDRDTARKSRQGRAKVVWGDGHMYENLSFRCVLRKPAENRAVAFDARRF